MTLREVAANALMDTLDQNVITIHKMGNTYQADHAQSNGNIVESAIDHVYSRIKCENIVAVKKGDIKSTCC